MLRLAYRGNRRLDLEDAEPEPLEPGYVRVRVHSAGICTSDVYGYSGVNRRRDEVLGPGEVLVMGHEAVGRVEEVAPDVEQPAPGTLVAINPIVGCRSCDACRADAENLCARRSVHGCIPQRPGSYAEFQDVPALNAVPLHDGAPAEWGALVEPLSVGAHGVRLAGVRDGDRVLVVGGGIIGLGAGLTADRRGGQVLVLEPQAERRGVCERVGLSAAHPDDVLGSDARFDVAIDCVARPETLAGALSAIPPGGTVALVGIWQDEIPFSVSETVGRELQIVGSYGYSHGDFGEVADWVSRGERDLSPIIQGRVGFDEMVETFERYADGSLKAMRTVLQPAGVDP
jgi:threonine dehydrogenase-like Zn-dependent dehydrogenase